MLQWKYTQFFKNLIPNRRKILYVKLHVSLLNINFFGFRQNFLKMAVRNGILGARAAVYRGATVVVGAEDGAARNGTTGAQAAVYRGAAVLSQRAAALSQRRTGGHYRRGGRREEKEKEKERRI